MSRNWHVRAAQFSWEFRAPWRNPGAKERWRGMRAFISTEQAHAGRAHESCTLWKGLTILDLQYLTIRIGWRNYMETIKPTYVLKIIVSSHSLVQGLASFAWNWKCVVTERKAQNVVKIQGLFLRETLLDSRPEDPSPLPSCQVVLSIV